MQWLRSVRCALIGLVGVLGAVQAAHASIIVYDFESFSDGTDLTSQLTGLNFSSASVLSAGISLNEFEFPPRSGSNVAFDSGAPLEIAFAGPATRVGGYFTYGVNLTLTAYDALGHVIDSEISQFNSNMLLSGDLGSAANEYLELAGAGIARVVFSGDALGGSFTLDDLSVETTDGNQAPEPSSVALAVVALLALGRVRPHRRAGIGRT